MTTILCGKLRDTFVKELTACTFYFLHSIGFDFVCLFVLFHTFVGTYSLFLFESYQESYKKRLFSQRKVSNTCWLVCLFVFFFTDSEAAKLIEKEEMERGSVALNVYGYYLKAVGIPLACIVAFGTISQTSLTVGTNFWLTAWSEAGVAVSM